MNAYADSLLTICLGWIKTVFRSIFNFFISDQSHSFGAWLGDHWLSLVLMLCLAGTLIDFAVYLRRYKPYLLWGKKKPQVKPAGGLDESRFDTGYQDGVILDPYVSGTGYFDPAESEEAYFSPFENAPAADAPAGSYTPVQQQDTSASPYAEPVWQPYPYGTGEQSPAAPYGEPVPEGYQMPYGEPQPGPASGQEMPAAPEYDDPYLNAPVLRRENRPRR